MTEQLERLSGWRTRWDIINYVPPEERPWEPPECPGKGQCHGCLKWCDCCGDVSDVCNVEDWPERCDVHERYPEKPERPEDNPRQLGLRFPGAQS